MIRASARNVLCRPFVIVPNYLRITPHSFVHPRPIPPICISRNLSSSRPTRAIFYIRFGDDSKSQSRKKFPLGPKEQWAIVLGVFGISYYVSHLERVPETGRWRFMNVSRKYEENIGKLVYEELLQENFNRILSPNHTQSRRVRRVVSRVLSASNLGKIRGSARDSSSFGGPGQLWGNDEASWNPDSQRESTYQPETHREWEVVVVDNPRVINAMAAPGVIVVFTGILPVCKDDHGLAAVLAHEIGHVVARHPAETVSSRSIYLALLTLVQYLGMDYLGITSLAHQLLLRLPHSRTMEYEADKIGLTLMSRACYNPRGAIEMFRRLHRIESNKSLADAEFLRTHPSGDKRVEELSKLLPEAYDVLNSNPDCTAVQERFMDPFRNLNVRGKRLALDDRF